MNGSGGFDGINDLLVARAATQIAFNGAGYFVPGWMIVLVEQRLRGHQESWRAKSTLRATVGRKARLNGGEMSAVRQALNRDDVRPLHLTGEGEAREFRYAVDHDGATTHVPKSQPALLRGFQPCLEGHQGGRHCSERAPQTTVRSRLPTTVSLGCGNHRNVLFAHHGRPYRSVGD